jgi:Mor family transcriptional regulator
MTNETVKKLAELSNEYNDPFMESLRNILGAEAFIKFVNHFSGITFYLSESLLQNLKKEYVKRNYNGYNVRLLAFEMEVCEKTIYRWLDEKAVHRQEVGLFD